ncbi:hypothetical protein [Hanstruepera ponticola]|uniref:hypothetical protein n=1 Tax=Hanstruepera ponticola TaxID=2042995 RepID=UPI0017867887|nr:hypothetical protein [Hanstruepera ponticola]
MITNPNQVLSGIKINEIRLERDNGTALTHDNGTAYAIVFFDAYTKKSADEINAAIKSYPSVSISYIYDLVKSNRLWKWMPRLSKKLKTLSVGDTCNILVLYDENSKDSKVKGFTVIDA